MLSAQQHYDWGLRALKTVLRGCGDMVRAERQRRAVDATKTTTPAAEITAELEFEASQIFLVDKKKYLKLLLNLI